MIVDNGCVAYAPELSTRLRAWEPAIYTMTKTTMLVTKPGSSAGSPESFSVRIARSLGCVNYDAARIVARKRGRVAAHSVRSFQVVALILIVA
jgi:hypothetical protein